MGCCLFAASACANSWGLKGELLQKVSSVHTWSDYTVQGSQTSDAAIMSARYDNLLMFLENGELVVNHKAVYPPKEKRSGRLTQDGKLLTLSYGPDEWYTFELFDRRSSEYGLKAMRNGSFSMERMDESNDLDYDLYRGTDESGTEEWVDEILLRDFNIQLFPRGLQEFRHQNDLCVRLRPQWDILKDQQTVKHLENIGSGTLPVYSAPSEQAWRAAKGKASVGLRGEVWALASVEREDGIYTLIRYDVSERTQRIGYVKKQLMDVELSEYEPVMDQTVIALRDTFLTDDPDVSQFPQLLVPEGTVLHCHDIHNSEYAYVMGRTTGGQLTQSGQWVGGFVPLRDLDIYDSPGQNQASDETRHMNYMLAALDSGKNDSGNLETICVSLKARRDTILKEKSGNEIHIPEGTVFTCDGVEQNQYAHVTGESGETGLVLLADLHFADGEHTDIQRDVMASLEGTWCFYAGGSQAEDILVLSADGTYRGYVLSEMVDTEKIKRAIEQNGRFEEAALWSQGTWQVTPYRREWNLYWNNPAYELTLFKQNSSVNVKGLELDDANSFSLTYWEGSGGYMRLSPRTDFNE